MSDKIENPVAFPSKTIISSSLGEGYSEHHGMTLRDYFAGQAVIALKSDSEMRWKSNYSDLAEYSYEIADALLKERMKK